MNWGKLPKRLLSKNKNSKKSSDSGPPSKLVARKLTVYALHGTLRGFGPILESISPEEAVEALNEFLTVVEKRVREYEGIFERYAGISFMAIWKEPEGQGKEHYHWHWKAVRCALDLRSDFQTLNQKREAEGKRPLFISMGIHKGLGLFALIGPEKNQTETVVGPVHAGARALDQIAFEAGVDLLATSDSLQTTEVELIVETTGRGKLTPKSQVYDFFTVHGYRDDQGLLQKIDSKYSKRAEVIPLITRSQASKKAG